MGDALPGDVSGVSAGIFLFPSQAGRFITATQYRQRAEQILNPYAVPAQGHALENGFRNEWSS